MTTHCQDFPMRTATLVLSLLLPGAVGAENKEGTWKAGTAVRKITPDQPQWLAGYSGRTRPAAGKYTEVFVKALALEDPAGARFVLLTSDLVGFSGAMIGDVARDVGQRTGVPRSRLLFTCSHTHTAPALADRLLWAYKLPPEEL
jgi:hypothetical protein